MWTNQKSLSLNKPAHDKGFLSFFITNPQSAQWNHILSGVMCVVGFALMLAFVVTYTIIEAREKAGDLKPKELVPPTPKIGVKTSKCVVVGDCGVTCTNLDTTDDPSTLIEKEFKKLDEATCENEIKNLILMNSKFTNSKLVTGWIVSDNYQIKELKISGGNLKNIDPGAFTGNVFQVLENLIIESIVFQKMKAETFKGLSVLTKLYLRDCTFLEIEAEALVPVADTLVELQVQQTINVFDPTNFTGTANFGAISLVDFRFNNLKDTINKESFAGLKKVKQFYLSGSQITQIGEKTFASLNNLLLLDLNNNALKNLNRNIFNTIDSKFKFMIDKNPWSCDCESVWLRNMLEEGVVTDRPTCASPDSVNGMAFLDVDFCDDELPSTENPQENSTSTSTIKPTSPTEKIIEISCKEYTSGLINTSRPYIYWDSRVAEITSPNVMFHLYDLDDGAVVIDILTTIENTDAIIWFPDDIDITESRGVESIGCITKLDKRIKIQNLVFGETYSFCVVGGMERKISPLNCRAHVVPKSWEYQTWLENKDRFLIILSLSFCFLICCFMGAAFLYFLVRRNPSLLRGSKRVVIVKHRVADAIVMPENFQEEPNTEPKSIEMRYINPKKFYTTTYKPKKVPFRRSISDSSMISGRSEDPTYVSALEPTRGQLLHWRLERLRGGTAGPLVESDGTPEISPRPLPSPPFSLSLLPDVPNLPSLCETSTLGFHEIICAENEKLSGFLYGSQTSLSEIKEDKPADTHVN